MAEPIKCLYFEHGYDQQVNGPCCYQSIPGVHSFTEMHKSPVYLEIKDSFASGRWPEKYCTKCRDVEQLHVDKNYSKRLSIFKDHKNADHWIPDKLYIMTIDTGSHCNIQCRICSVKHSSSWKDETKVWYKKQYNAKQLDKPISFDPNFYDDAQDDLSYLKSVNLIGGEPLYGAETSMMLEKIFAAAGPNVYVSISTNGTVNYKNMPILKKFKNINLVFSIDAVGRAFEFIRTGANWDTVDKNIHDWAEVNPVLLHPTYGLLNTFELVKLSQYMKQMNIAETAETNFLSYPEYLNYSVLTDQERETVIAYLISNGFDHIAKNAGEYTHNAKNRKNFFKYMEHTKEYYGLDWQEYLPELYNLMNSN
jgi:MoaA/NifB/PqqE/SkfB family radical SAM enzyme